MNSDQRRHVLYRFFGADDALLYVGITCNPSRRFEKHSAEKAWWYEVARISFEHFPDRKSVLSAERDAIQREKPIHNVLLNGNGSQPTPEVTFGRSHGLVGRCFHTWRDRAEASENATIVRGRALHWQGHVVDQVEDGVYLVELFSWLDGCPTDTRIATLDEMRDWTFYDSSLEMQIAMPCGEHHRDGAVCSRPVTHYQRSDFGVSFHCWSCVEFYPGYSSSGEIQWKNGKPVCP